MKLASLRVTTWAETVSHAIHYYGTICFWDREEVAVETRISSGRAKELNRDEEFDGNLSPAYKARDKTSRYYTREEVHNAGVEVFLENPHGCDCLVAGDELSAEPKYMLWHADERFKLQANNLYYAWFRLEESLQTSWNVNAKQEAELELLSQKWFEFVQPEERPAARTTFGSHKKKSKKKKLKERLKAAEPEKVVEPAPKPLGDDYEVIGGKALSSSGVTSKRKAAYPRPKDFPVGATVPLPIHVSSVKGKHVSTMSSETFYTAVTEVTDPETDATVGWMRAGLDCRLAITRGDTRILIDGQELWHLLQPAFDEIEEKGEFRMTGDFEHCNEEIDDEDDEE